MSVPGYKLFGLSLRLLSMKTLFQRFYSGSI